VPALTGLLYGYGLFETMRPYRGARVLGWSSTTDGCAKARRCSAEGASQPFRPLEKQLGCWNATG
jgi:hypothetical protein